MPWPNFVVIGAARSGTTSLYNYLKQHPDVYMSPVKEPGFLAPASTSGGRHRVSAKRACATDEAAYMRLFEQVEDEKAVGEASPGYLYKAGAAERMHGYVPNAKLIAILRHPVERAYSNYMSLRGSGKEPITDFHEAMRAEERRMRANWSPHWFYRRNGLYAKQLARYLEVFPREQICVHLHKDLKEDAEALMRDLYAFLGVDDTFVPKMRQRHNTSGVPKNSVLHALTTNNPMKRWVKPYAPRWVRDLGRRITAKNTEKPALDEETKRKLTDAYYREDISALEDLIGRDLSDWLA